MPTIRDGEQARRIPFGSPAKNASDLFTTPSSSSSSSSSSSKSQSISAEGRSKQDRPILRDVVPALNIITSFTSPKQSPSHRRDLSIQDRRKQATKLTESSQGLQSISALSPSDGELVIGMSLQPEVVETRNSGLNIRKSMAPDIVITPAGILEDPWKGQHHRPRSSVYSQMTRISKIGETRTDQYPPMPPIPKEALQYVQPVSATSWNTDFSDGGDRDDFHRRYSGESRIGIVRNTSVNTNRRWSEGWWNTLMSPIFRSNTITTKKANTTPVIGEKTSEKIQVTESATKDEKPRGSIFSDLSKLDQQRLTLAFFHDSPTENNKDTSGMNEKTLSPELVQEGGFGMASEYYEASWHDAYSTVPFFTCLGHDCSQKVAYRHGRTIGGPDEGMAIPQLTERNLATLSSKSSDIECPVPTSQNHSDQMHLWNESNAIGPDQRLDSSSVVEKAISRTPIKDGSTTSEQSYRLDSQQDRPTHESNESKTFQTLSHSRTTPTRAVLSSPTTTKVVDERADTLLPATIKSTTPRKLIDKSPLTSPSHGGASKKPSKPVVTVIEDPFQDIPYCASPEVLTPGLQREFEQHKAIPLAQRAASFTTTSTRKDPLAIAEPRKAPLPPRHNPFINSNSNTSVPPVEQYQQQQIKFGFAFAQHNLSTTTIQSSQTITTMSSASRHPWDVAPTPAGFELPRSKTPKATNTPKPPKTPKSKEKANPTVVPIPATIPKSQSAPSNPIITATNGPVVVPVQSAKQSEPRPQSQPAQGQAAPTQPSEIKVVHPLPTPKALAKVEEDAEDKKKEKEKEKKKRRRHFMFFFCFILIIILIVILALCLTLVPASGKPNELTQVTPVTVPGLPPITPGIATIIQPEAAVQESQCVAPNTLWSCALPKEQQASIAPNEPNQPNFRLEIRFANGTSALQPNNTIVGRRWLYAFNARSFIKNRLLGIRDSSSGSPFSPSPVPPTTEDQDFLGRTTDNNTTPYGGEATPFFITFSPASKTAASKRTIVERDVSTTSPFPNVTIEIPPPDIATDGTAADVDALPYPTAQPLMLYNRGRVDEHYGFYNYFDKSIFLKATDLLNSTGPDIPDNSNGGAIKSAADVRCTWAQTRFLVQIWTKGMNTVTLVGSNKTADEATSIPNSASVRPGSFPYPVTITIDRHGGDLNQKMVYCYGMDQTNHIIRTQKQVHLENRQFGGPGLVNQGGSLFGGPVNVSLADGGPGGIDGGYGGCLCQWRNWALN